MKSLKQSYGEALVGGTAAPTKSHLSELEIELPSLSQAFQ